MAEIYVATDGDDGNGGTIDAPLATFREAIREQSSPGDTIKIRGGEYDETLLFYFFGGEEGAPLTAEPHEDEDVILNRAQINQSHVIFRDLEITGNNGEGLKIVKPDAHDILIENCEFHHNMGDGATVSEGAHDITVRDCDGHNNYDAPASEGGKEDEDPGDRNADGFNVTLRSYDVAFENCRAWHNVDDGYDTNQAGGGIRFLGCQAWDNGINQDGQAVGNGSGIKLQNGRPGDKASGDQLNPSWMVRCAAWNNRHNIRVVNAYPEIWVVNCTAWNPNSDYEGSGFSMWNYLIRSMGNGQSGYLVNSIAAGPDGTQNKIADSMSESSNFWQLDIDGTEPGFASADPSSSAFLRLATDSPCIGAGTVDTGPVTIEFDGAPDLGAYQAYQRSPPLRVNDGGTFVTPRNVRHYDGNRWISTRLSTFDGERFVTAFDGRS
jgi:hypothetical protein